MSLVQNAYSIFCASFIFSTVLAGNIHVPAEFCFAQHVELEYARLPLKFVERHSHVYFRRVKMSGKHARSSHITYQRFPLVVTLSDLLKTRRIHALCCVAVSCPGKFIARYPWS
jgi:hypothetical protein